MAVVGRLRMLSLTRSCHATLLLLAACSASSPPAQPADPWEDVRAYVTASLKDPDSARFAPFRRGKGSAVCGSVNARNGFGGYTGMEPFVYLPASATEGDRFYIYTFHSPVGDWDERGRLAETFEEHGCSVGPDHQRAIAAIRALRQHDRGFAAGNSDGLPATQEGESDSDAVQEPAFEPPSLCWQDYCPCEPPQGGPDQMLCRRLRAGLPVDDELMSAGAGLRDAREQLEQWERENPGY
jgi:hypothetical protein